VYELAVRSIASSGTITVIPAKPGYTITPDSLQTEVYGIRITETYSAAGVSFKMISAFPSGTIDIRFPMGTDNSGTGRVTTAYQIGETEVTWELWNTVRMWADDNEYTFSDEDEGDDDDPGNREPVANISWYDAVVWCNALTEWYNANTGTALTPVYRNEGEEVIKEIPGDDEGDWEAIPNTAATGFRLPAGVEWELAARWQGKTAITTNLVYNGGYFYTEGDSASGAEADFNNAAATSAVGWYNLPDRTPQPVKGKAPNALGLYDVSGNVSEWCFDKGTGEGDVYIIRGGSYLDSADKLQIGKVDQSLAEGGTTIGFRLARTVK
jgi:formylglycine-generating enzyme required for sulfatase activity